MKKALQIGNGIALIVTIVVNYLSNTGIFNGNTMAEVSAQYENLFTPAGYAFSIWGIIYILLLGFVIFYGRGLFDPVREDRAVKQIGWWFIISCAANSLWVVVWLYEKTLLSILVMIVLFFSLLKIMLNTKMELHNAPLKKFAFLWWPFSIYSGWVSVALIANIAAYLTKINWNGFGISETSWAVIMILIAGAVHVLMTWKRNMREFAAVGVWALIAIAVANHEQNTLVYWTAIGMALLVFINISVHAFQNRKSLPL